MIDMECDICSLFITKHVLAARLQDLFQVQHRYLLHEDGQSGFAKRCLRRRVCTWGLAYQHFIVFVIVLIPVSFWFVCPRHILLLLPLLPLLLLLLVVILTISATGAGGAAGVGTAVVLQTYIHVNDTATARKWSWSIRTKRYRFLTLYRFTTLCNYAAYTPMSQTYRFPAHLQSTKFTSSTAQGGGGSFKNRKRIGEIDCCEWQMSEQKHWPTE